MSTKIACPVLATVTQRSKIDPSPPPQTEGAERSTSQIINISAVPQQDKTRFSISTISFKAHKFGPPQQKAQHRPRSC